MKMLTYTAALFSLSLAHVGHAAALDRKLNCSSHYVMDDDDATEIAISNDPTNNNLFSSTDDDLGNTVEIFTKTDPESGLYVASDILHFKKDGPGVYALSMTFFQERTNAQHGNHVLSQALSDLRLGARALASVDVSQLALKKEYTNKKGQKSYATIISLVTLCTIEKN